MSDKLPVPEPTADQGPAPEEDEEEQVENVESVEEEHFDLPPDLQPILPLEPPTAMERKLEEIYEKLYRIEFHLATAVRERLADIVEKVEKIELRQLNLPIPNTGFGADVPPMKNSKYHQTPPPPEEADRGKEEEEEEQGSSIQCVFCNGDHFASECREYPTLMQRQEQAMRKRKCTRCLFRANHLAMFCRTKARCFYCKRDNRIQESYTHHTAFCPHQFRMYP
ncbi:unnamed protein product [Heligmosomoides polygyrus]|uniref:Nanos-type domain-containing protein n=1 Tax=Heligmosomoides polygyrus TaxID=6339 RepID=A0A183GWZ0_HELPZ|nr:unnamed protein product [Heligmosomoides polygyrus]